MEYLGVTLQKRLSWTPHVKNRIQKINRLVGSTRKMISSEWGLTTDKLSWVYKAIARPKLMYGALVWAADMPENIKKLLNKTQRKFLRLGTGALRSTPTEAMNVVARWKPLDLHAEELAIRARIRTKNILNDTWDGLPSKGKNARGHKKIWDKMTPGMKITEIPPNKEHSWAEWDNLKTEEETELQIYTDGASNELGAGYALVVYSKGVVNPIYTENKPLGATSPYQAELFAIKASLNWLQSNPEKLQERGSIRILSDSRQAVLSLRSTAIKNKMVKDILDILTDIKKQVKIGLQWIKGHSNITGNDLADKLAREAIKLPIPKINLPITTAEIKIKVNNLIFDKWQSRWDFFGPEIAKKFYPTIPKGKLKTESRITNKDFGTLYQACQTQFGSGAGSRLSVFRRAGSVKKS